jgi:hypothetical protein
MSWLNKNIKLKNSAFMIESNVQNRMKKKNKLNLSLSYMCCFNTHTMLKNNAFTIESNVQNRIKINKLNVMKIESL